MNAILRCGFLVLALLLALTVPVNAGPFEDGAAAYQRGNYVKALNFWRPLADQGYAPAQRNLGAMYANGEGVPQDRGEAVLWFQKAAEQGYAPAQLSLAVSYRFGRGVRKDYNEAVKWFRMAAEQGYAHAQAQLGFLYYHGRGVPQDYAEAAKWTGMAAEQGHAEAQFNSGVMYTNGEGVPQDNVLAHMWFNLAAEQGYGGAQENRDNAAELMTPSQIAEAQRMAREWLAKHQQPSAAFSKVPRPRPYSRQPPSS